MKTNNNINDFDFNGKVSHSNGSRDKINDYHVNRLFSKYSNRILPLSPIMGREIQHEFYCSTHDSTFISTVRWLLKPSCMGCPKCNKSNYKQRMINHFIEKSKSIHGDKYDYSLINVDNYINGNEKVPIKCIKHGVFFQNLFHHSNGHKCPKCSRRLGPQEFLRRARLVHGDIYEYILENVEKRTDRMRVICKKHGEFTPTVNNHLSGCGCPDCHKKNKIKSIDQFIMDARKAHGGKYDYSKVIYTGNKNKITIICPKHGDFKQTPLSHIHGTGCPRCRESFGDVKVSMLLDRIKLTYIREMVFPNTKFRYDFYLPDLNLLIEYHGEQHYQPVDRFGGVKGFEVCRKRDREKKKLAKQLGLDLIVVHYRFLMNDKSGNTLNKYLINSLLKYYPYSFSYNGSFNYLSGPSLLYENYPLANKVELKDILNEIRDKYPGFIPLRDILEH